MSISPSPIGSYSSSDFFADNAFGRSIFETRYAQNGETWEQSCRRQADAVGYWEMQKYRDEFYNLLVQGKAAAGGRIAYSAGYEKASMLNCYVIPIGDSREGWGKYLNDTVVISGTGGGIGTNFSAVRPRGADIRGTGGIASGAVSVMRMGNGVGEEIRGGGGRRAAYMFCLNHNHPDILEFLDAKLESSRLPRRLIDILLQSGVEYKDLPADLLRGELNCANISIAFMDEDPADFFERVKADGDHNLVFEGKIVRTIKARELWDRITKNALKNGEPGLLNGWYANEMNNISYCRKLESTNPCVTADTWVTTSEGAQQVSDLLGTPFTAIVNGIPYACPTGFVHTGTKDIFNLRTSKGYALRLTANHKVLVRTKGRQTEWKEAGSLDLGDKIVLQNHRSLQHSYGQGDFEKGWLLGSLVGDGSIVKESKYNRGFAALDFWGAHKDTQQARSLDFIKGNLEYRGDMKGCSLDAHDKTRVTSTALLDYAASLDVVYGNKTLSPKVEKASASLIQGFLRGWFDADGSIQGNLLKGISVRLSSIDLKGLEAAQRCLIRFGIVSTIYSRRTEGYRNLPNGKGGSAPYFCQDQYDLVIAKDNIYVFADQVGFYDPAKSEKLSKLLGSYRREPYKEQFVDAVVSMESVGTDNVYDCTVPEVEAFDANGLYVHNCGEVWMQPYSVCCLGSIVLPRFVNELKLIDWNGLRKTVHTMVRFLDNVLDVTTYPIPEVKKESQDTRRIGLGYMGLHDTLLLLGHKYSTPAGRTVASQIAEFIKIEAYTASVNLAKERGPFKLFNAKKFCDSPFVQSLPLLLQQSIAAHGVRNCALLTIAPYGTTSIVQGVSSGLEPMFAPVYERNWQTPEGIKTETLTHPLFEQFVRAGRSVEHFEASEDIAPEDHLLMQIVIQEQIDNSISKTICIPQEKYTEETLSDLYMTYFPYIKGLTIYPVGSRLDTPLRALPLQAGIDMIKGGESHTAVVDNDCIGGVCSV